MLVIRRARRLEQHLLQRGVLGSQVRHRHRVHAHHGRLATRGIRLR